MGGEEMGGVKRGDWNWRKVLWLVIVAGILSWIAGFLSACSSHRSVGVSRQDSVAVMVRVDRSLVDDTVEVGIVGECVRSATLDTISELETELARSVAVIDGGVLRHTLETKPQRLKVGVKKEVVTRDSVVCRERAVERAVERKSPARWWMRLVRWLPWVLLAAAFWVWIRKRR